MAQRKPELDEAAAARTLLAFMSSPKYRPLLQRDLLHHAQVPGPQRAAYARLLRRLIRQGRVRRLRGGRLVAAGQAAPAALAPRPESVGSARGARVVGVFLERRRGGIVQLFGTTRGEPIDVPAQSRSGVEELHAVTVEIVRAAVGERPAEGRIVEDLGHLDARGTDGLVVTRKHGLAGDFPAEVQEQARALPGGIAARESAGRERFDGPPPVTIDGESARDFDDAVAVQELAQGGFRLFVHIADVAHFVTAGSALDLEARLRGTSVYFPDRVIPMLPEQLSNDLCSLVPGQDRLVQSIVLDFTKTGKLRKTRFADGVICSAARLTYSQVARVLEGAKRGHGVPARLLPMLLAANRLREVLEERRHARGSIDFDLPEPQILLDVEGAMTGITVEPRNLAHRLIEEFMLAANEAVAEHLWRGGTAAVYRVHEPPDPVKLDALGRFVEGFGHELRARDAPTVSKEIQRLLEEVESRPEARVIHQVALRTMNQARYSPENAGHFALAAPSYAHFTSPIRRYPDLVVHRQLRALRRRDARAPHDRDEMSAIAESSSARERSAEAAERELLAWKKVAFISEHVGESFDGLVTGVTRFGLFVQLIDNLVEGLVRVELLGSEWFEFDERRFELAGAQSGTAYRLGDRLRVRVVRVDKLLQRVDLLPDDDRAGAARGGESRRPRGRQRVPRRRSARR